MSTQEESKGETATNPTNPTTVNELLLEEFQRLRAATETIADVLLHNARQIDSSLTNENRRSPDYRALEERATLRHQHWQGSVGGFKYPFFNGTANKDFAQETEGVSGDGIPWSSQLDGQ